jgi:ArsR family transcriptional regulator
MPSPNRARRSESAGSGITDRTLSDLVQKFKLLADESRLRILFTLAREGEMNVSAVCRRLGQSQPAVSHHLTLLRVSGLVGYRRVGKFNYYRLDGTSLAELLDRVFGEAGRADTINLGEFSLAFSRNVGRRR